MKIKELLNNSDKWIKGHEAETSDGRIISVLVSTLAIPRETLCKFCLVGATKYCYGYDSKYSLIIDKIDKTIASVYADYEGNIPQFNDRDKTKFEDIKKVLELADV